MRRHRAFLCLALASAFVLTFHHELFAQIVFNNGEINQIDGPSADVEVSNGPGGAADPTTLIVVEGAEMEANDDDRSVGLLENSILTINGGLLEGTIEAHGNSFAEIHGGVVEDKLITTDQAHLVVNAVTAEDAVEAEDDSLIEIYGGEFEDEVVAADEATINILGGQFVNVFSDGADLIAEGGTINVTGGFFGQAGLDDGGSAIATLGGTLNYSGATLAGMDTGDAPTATFRALINAEVHVADSEFAHLVLEAGNNGVLHASGYQAESVEAHAIAGGTVNLLGSGADQLDISVELGGIVNLFGGQFGDIDAALLDQGILNVHGHSFKYNNVPLENVDAVFGPGGYDPATGELRFVAGLLSGILANGDPFELSFQRQFTAGAKLFVQNIPEPNSIALGIAAAMLMICFNRD